MAQSMALSSRSSQRSPGAQGSVRGAASMHSRRWVAGYPELLAQWDWEKNRGVLPEQVSYGSHLRLWWRCEKGPDHSWRAQANTRTHGSGCPFCAGRLVSITNCLATRCESLSAQWHPERNGSLTPYDVVWSCNEVAWWRCEAAPDHEWRARINNRSSNDAGCPFCSGNAVAESWSLAGALPELAAQWHPSANRGLLPSQVATQSNLQAWWKCGAGPDHEWQAAIQNRVRGAGCPFCAGRRVADSNCLATRCPELAREWHPSANRGATPRDFSWSSNHEVWWQCASDESHEWRARINNRSSNGSGCPACARQNRSRGDQSVRRATARIAITAAP